MAGGEAKIEPRPTGPVSTRALVTQRRSQREGGREERRCAEMMAARV